MFHSIILEVPETIYQPLAEEAKSKGRKIEEIVLEKLVGAEPKQVSDPLDKFIGAFKSDIADWADNHDKYLGEDLAKDLKFKK